MASSSSGSTPSNIKYDVFVSYCFEDTGNNFTSHLRSAFDREGIIAFIDNRKDEGEPPKRKQGLEKGESDAVLNKISKSLVSVVIFSENYGGSPRCLNELLEIIRCMLEYRRYVLPVFRGVEPSHVRKQKGAFGKAFENMLTLNQQLKVDKEEKWKSALVEAADLSGWDSNNTSCEAEMVKKVVERIKKLMNQQPTHDISGDGFVGMSRVKEVESLLCLESKDVRSIGIWGTGGIGKTTIAERVYSRVKNQFDGACFLADVGKRLDGGDLGGLNKDMFSQLLESHYSQGPLNWSTMAIQRALQRNKFLIVLDDVSDPLKLKSLIKPHKFYGPGSRIILTSRDKQVLKKYDCEEEYIYEVPKLNGSEALSLFEFHAFKKPCEVEYKVLSEKAVDYAKGLPLALEVLGCNLCEKNVEEWANELEKLEKIPDITINGILMNSYAGLDKTQKEMFLDIACVFKGWHMDEVERIFDACNFFPTSGIRYLCDKALITISSGILEMHALLQQMGLNIVTQECEENPGKLGRIWKYKDFHDVMTQNKVTEKVKVISVDISQATNMVLMPEAFEKMSRLRVLNLYHYFSNSKINERRSWYDCFTELACCIFPWHHSKGVAIHLPKGLRFTSDKLAYFRWDSYPSKSLPDNFNPSRLVELKLVGSSIVHLRSGGVEPDFPNLKVMDLSYSKVLISLPNFSRYPNLEILVLEGCYKLREIPSSIQHLRKLVHLNLNCCRNLKKLPELAQCANLWDCANLLRLDLEGCSVLMREIQRYLKLKSCRNLKKLPELAQCASLERLELEGCYELREMPSSIQHLHKLTLLNLKSCRNLKKLAELPQNIKNLIISGCENLSSLPESIGELQGLHKLDVDGCSSLTSLPESLGKLQSLWSLSIRRSAVRNIEVPVLPSLNIMDLSNSDLESLPASINQLSRLSHLYLNGCKNLTYMPDLPSSLHTLMADGCTSLRSLGSLFGERTSSDYDVINLANCFNLDEDSKIRSVTAARSKIEAIVALAKYDGGKAVMCIPGGRVPEWVEYRDEGSLIKLKLLGCCTLEDLSRLVFCIVVPSGGNYVMDVCCKCLFVSREIGRVQVGPDNRTLTAVFKSEEEHVVLWYRNIRNQLLQHVYRYDDDEDRFFRRSLTHITCSDVTFEFQYKFRSPYRRTRCKEFATCLVCQEIATCLRCGVVPLGRSYETGRGNRFQVMKI